MRRGAGGGAVTLTVVPVAGRPTLPDTVPVTRGLGTIRVAVGEGDSHTDAAGNLRTRFRLPYRADDRTVEILVPAAAEERGRLGDGRTYWRGVGESDSFALEVAGS